MRFHYIFVDLEFISLFFLSTHKKQVSNSLLVHSHISIKYANTFKYN
jgi:hypothetical protein